MNDYFTRNLAVGRQADYMREVEHEELVAEAKRGTASHKAETTGSGVHHGWRMQSFHIRPARMHLPGHHG